MHFVDMSKKTVVIIFLLVFFLGCGKASPELVDADCSDEYIEGEYDDLEVKLDSMQGKDNSLDEYMASVHEKLEISTPPDDFGGGYRLFLGSNYGFFWQKHNLEKDEDSFDDISIVTCNGDICRTEVSADEQYMGVGPVFGESSHVCARVTKDEATERHYYIIEKYTSEGTIVDSISLKDSIDDFDDLYIVQYLAIDGNGAINIYASSLDDSYRFYYLIDENGILLRRFDMSDFTLLDMIQMYDGQVGLNVCEKVEANKQIDKRNNFILKANGDTLTKVLVYDEPLSQYEGMNFYDERTVVYGNSKGIFLNSIDFSDEQMIYRWENHGIKESEVISVSKQKDGVGVVYRKGADYFYLFLEKVFEKRDIQQIVIAVSPNTASIYASAASDFNKKYPGYAVSIKSDYEETLLLTELIARNGPVLIDSSLIGFEENEKMWEPLDKILDKLGIVAELNECAKELGAIGTHTYGVVPFYYIDSVVANSEFCDWNYSKFIEAANEEKYNAIVNSEDMSSDKISTIVRFMLHSADDNYFIDFQNRKTTFKSREFKEMLRLIDSKVSERDYIENGPTSLKEGVLCNQLIIRNPYQLDAYRVVYADEYKFVGYPHREGSYSIISSISPLCMRRTASLEEKEVACAFIKTLLSKETQLLMSESDSFGFSIRDDVLEVQFDKIDGENPVYLEGIGNICTGERANNQEDRLLLREILKGSKPRKNFPRELTDIILEELDCFFNGNLTEEELCKLLESRTSIYLAENY